MSLRRDAARPARRDLRVLRHGQPTLFFLALAVGTVITAVLVVAAKQFIGKSDAEIEAAEPVAA